MPDRIDAGVFAMAAAVTGGEVNLVGANLDHLGVVRYKLEQMGVEFAATARCSTCAGTVRCARST